MPGHVVGVHDGRTRHPRHDPFRDGRFPAPTAPVDGQEQGTGPVGLRVPGQVAQDVVDPPHLPRAEAGLTVGQVHGSSLPVPGWRSR